MDKKNYFDGTRHFKCKSCGMLFKESFIIDKRVFLSELNQIKTPSVSIHKRCINDFCANDEQYYGIGELIGVSVKDFEEDTNGE